MDKNDYNEMLDNFEENPDEYGEMKKRFQPDDQYQDMLNLFDEEKFDRMTEEFLDAVPGLEPEDEINEEERKLVDRLKDFYE